MPAAEPLIDVSALDLGKFEFGIEAIRELNPHRHEMELLDGIVRFWPEDPLRAVAVHLARPDEFWTRGHFPGNPLFPGVLMVEAAAQASSFCFHKRFGKIPGKIFGFGGLEGVRFRGAVRPGDRVALLVRAHALRMQRAVFDVQGWVGDKMVCEGRVIGVTIPAETPKEAEA